MRTRGRKYSFGLLVLTALLLMSFGASAQTVFQTVSSASDGCVLVAVEGSYQTDTQAAIDRINEIRLEACQQGIRDPRDESRTLTEADYVPIKWSNALEYIARVRAAEASAVRGHTRPNGADCFSVEAPNGMQSYGEVLAYNSYDGSMVAGVDNWYEEKEDWVNKTSGKVTGHYTSMIDPDNTYVGLAAFTNKRGFFAGEYGDGYTTYTASGEFSSQSGGDTRESAIPDCKVIIEVQKSALTELMLTKTSETLQKSGALDKGDTLQYKGELTLSMFGSTSYVLPQDTSWTSSNTSAAKVDSNGKVTITGAGSAVITASAGGSSASVTLTPKHTVPSDWTVAKKASFTADGQKVKVCEVCGETVQTSAISHIETAALVSTAYTYTGKAITPAAALKDAKGTALSSSSYKVTYKNNKNAGTATAVITAAGDYTGTKSLTFTIKPCAISSGKAAKISAKAYTGSAIKPAPPVTLGGVTLTAGTDYTVSYANNTKIGTATVTITGKGNYTGTLKTTFTINAPKGTALKHTKSNGRYRVTKAGASGTAEVEFVKPVKAAASATIPSKITVGGCVFKVTSIAKSAFKESKLLQTVTIGKSITSIGSLAFYKCRKLSTVKLTAGIKTIGSGAFNGCTALTSIVLPSTVTRIDKRAFYACKNLKTIQINSTRLIAPNIGAEAFAGIYKKAVIKVPASKVSTYKSILLKRGVKAGMKVTKK